MKTDTTEGRSRDPSGESRVCAWNPEHRRGVLRWQQGHSPTGSRREGRGIPWGRFGEERVSVTLFFCLFPAPGDSGEVFTREKRRRRRRGLRRKQGLYVVASGGKENKCTGTCAGTMANFRRTSYLRSYVLPSARWQAMHFLLSHSAVLLEVKLNRGGITFGALKPCADHKGPWVPPEQAGLSGKAWARACRGHWIPAKMVLAHLDLPRLPGTPHSRSICRAAPTRPLLLIPTVDAGLSLAPGLPSAQSTSCPRLAYPFCPAQPHPLGSPCPSLTSECLPLGSGSQGQTLMPLFS